LLRLSPHRPFSRSIKRLAIPVVMTR
jgi:hypothetical protein